MKFLIPTEPDDTHAILVKLALEKLGHKVILIFTADQPTRQKNSVFINVELYKWQSSDEFNSIVNDDYEVVWWRRARRPYVPKNISHPNDHNFVARENILFYESFTSTMAPNAWWVNTKESAGRANFKLLQLKIASECGMTIPTTLCSNDPKEIHQFLTNHSDTGVIYKPLCSNFWFESEQVKVSYTSRVQPGDLPRDELLQQTPGIFQTEVKKKYELRVTCFGDYIVTAKINSQAHFDGIVDWRAIRHEPMKVEEYKLPINIEMKIRAFMREIGIVFGSFDFIVTPDDQYIFLEVNEQGQFLWIEELNPNIKMLDIFINFLLNKSPHYVWDERNVRHTIDKYRSQIQKVYDDNMQKHISLNQTEVTLMKEQDLQKTSKTSS
jgi:glutathione synthase/RimK-type ligase-like ATP-grasp enzyme